MANIINQVDYSIGSGIKQSYVVAIPTYNRVDEVVKKTLNTLKTGGVSANQIYLFVANKQQYTLYEQSVPKELYYKIVIGKKGITNQRIFISNYFKEGQYVISMDDDVEQFDILKGGKLVKLTKVNNFFLEAYELMKLKNLYLWGIYPVRNAFFMKDEVTFDLRFIIGVTFGFITRHDKQLKMSIKAESKEDYEQSILYFLKDGGVIRYNNVTAKTKFNAPGGLGQDRFERNKNASEYLTNKYPDIVSRNDRDDGTPEVKLAKLPATIEGGKLNNKDLDRYNLENENVYVDQIKLTPRVELLQNKVLELLENTKIPTVQALRSKTVGKNGFSFNFGSGKIPFHANGEYSTNKKYPELFKAIVEYGNEILPTGFDYTAITVNKNLKAKKHIDGSNDGLGCITFLGDYKKGGLYIYENGKPKLYNTKGVVIAFNGAMVAHRTEAFTGDRYALIFYKQKNKFNIKGVKMEGRGIEVGDDNLKIY
jgi:hypothetical protein